MGVKERTFIENSLNVPIHKFVDQKSYLDVGSKKVWASFRACHITASIMLSTVFKVTGSATGAEVSNKDIDRLLSTPNPWDSWEELVYQWVFHMKLCGVAYWVKDQINGKNQPLHIYPLIPQYVKVVPDEKKRIKEYVYEVNGRRITFQPEEIIHFRRPHPSHTIDGLGDIEPAESLFTEYIMRGELEAKFLANGATPSGILTKKEAVEDEGEWEKLKAKFKADYEGKRNVGKTAFLNGDWKYVKLGLSHSEMQSIENERWSISQIFNNHGVPLSLAGLEKAANYATARQDEINFRRYEIVPLLDILVGKLNSLDIEGKGTLIRAFSPNWRLSYELSGLVDVEQTVKEYKPLAELGAITLNELRELCGLEASPNALLNQHFVNSSRLPVEMSGLTSTVPETPQPDTDEEEDETEESEDMESEE